MQVVIVIIITCPQLWTIVTNFGTIIEVPFNILLCLMDRS